MKEEGARAIKLYTTHYGKQKSLDLMPFIDQLNQIFRNEDIQIVLKFLNLNTNAGHTTTDQIYPSQDMSKDVCIITTEIGSFSTYIMTLLTG